MNRIIPKLRILKLNGDVIVAPRKWENSQIKDWYKRQLDDLDDNIRFEAVSLTDQMPRGETDYATAIEKAEFDLEDLPLFLWELTNDKEED